jgi:hypothetical protein
VTSGSTTTNRDFKVKHGLEVANGGTFGQAVTVGTPTENAHAATKLYVDGLVGTGTPIVPTESTAPANPVDGQLWFDTVSRHLSIYSTDASDWIMIATFSDTADLRQHIHDTAIDGTGLIVSVFQDAGFYDSIFTSTEIAGFYDSAYWNNSYDGGSPLDNFS